MPASCASRTKEVKAMVLVRAEADAAASRTGCGAAREGGR